MVKVEILVSPSCVYCDSVKRRVYKVVEEFKTRKIDVNVKEIDVLKHPEIMLKYEISSTPALAVNGELTFIGVPKEDEIRRKLQDAVEKYE
jgi:glutaredoxin